MSLKITEDSSTIGLVLQIMSNNEQGKSHDNIIKAYP